MTPQHPPPAAPAARREQGAGEGRGARRDVGWGLGPAARAALCSRRPGQQATSARPPAHPRQARTSCSPCSASSACRAASASCCARCSSRRALLHSPRSCSSSRRRSWPASSASCTQAGTREGEGGGQVGTGAGWAPRVRGTAAARQAEHKRSRHECTHAPAACAGACPPAAPGRAAAGGSWQSARRRRPGARAGRDPQPPGAAAARQRSIGRRRGAGQGQGEMWARAKASGCARAVCRCRRRPTGGHHPAGPGQPNGPPTSLTHPPQFLAQRRRRAPSWWRASGASGAPPTP